MLVGMLAGLVFGCAKKFGSDEGSDTTTTEDVLTTDTPMQDLGPECQPEVCQGGNLQCCDDPQSGRSVCIDISSSTDHCGGCDQACPEAPDVVAPMCTDLGLGATCAVEICEYFHADCDEIFDTGCEIETDRDLQNCGACGLVCNQGEVCVSGNCSRYQELPFEPPATLSTEARLGWSLVTQQALVVVGAPGGLSDAGAALALFTTGGESNSFDGTVLLEDTQGEAGFELGTSVAISFDGTLIAVGDADAGRVLVFERQDFSQFVEIARVQGPINERFGAAVAIDTSQLLVGAPEATPGGEVRIFLRDGAGFATTPEQTLAGESAGPDLFGTSLALGGNTLVVGAPESAETTSDGKVYIFQNDALGWTEQASFSTEQQRGCARFGQSVSLYQELLVVGAPFHSDRCSSAADLTGRAYVFEGSGSTWSPVLELRGNATAGDDGFGEAVNIVGNRVVVGAPREGSSTQGAVYLAQRIAEKWLSPQRLVSPAPRAGEHFGAAVALHFEGIFVGAPGAVGEPGMLYDLE